MARSWLVGILFFMTASTLFAQEQVVGLYTVHLGVMSWESIQTGNRGEESSLSARQQLMAKQMAAMHGGGTKGDYHVLVVIDDRDTGRPIEDADVRVVVSGPGSRRGAVTLERMEMAGFVGYGGFLKFNFAEPYHLRVSFSRPSDTAVHEVEFSHSP